VQSFSAIFQQNYALTVALSSWLAAQVAKTIINFVLAGQLDIERMWGAGGMPSAHSALVCSLVIAIAKTSGTSSPLFAIAFVLAAIVMYDAMGVRRAAGQQAKVINRLLSDREDEEELLPDGKKLKEMVGHTPLEVGSGALLGILIGVLFPVV